MSFTEAAVIAGEGPWITLKDGRKLQLHFGYGGMKRIEERFPNGGLT